MTYSKTVWQNNRPPAINAENLNKIETALESHDTGISTLTTQVGDLSDLDTTAKTDLVSAINEVAQNTITVDSTLSSTSENPVQNKVINSALNALPTLSFDPLQAGTEMDVTIGSDTMTFYDDHIVDSMISDIQQASVLKTSVKSTVTSGNTDPVNSVAVIAYINSLDATNTAY